MFGRIAAFLYGVACYVVSLACFAYLAGFLGNFLVPHSIDSVRQGSWLAALAINCALLLLFGLQHSIMARPGFKAVWTKFVPKTVERSTYLLFSCAALFVLFWKWQPMGGLIWSVDNATGQLALQCLYACGWVVVLLTTFLINHFELFGLQQVWLNLLGRKEKPARFVTPGPYRLIRHPLYFGWLLVFWSSPVMTAAHLVFALGTTAYILVAIQYEERDLTRVHGEYAEYRKKVPMILPLGTNRVDVGRIPSAGARQAS